MAENIKNLNMAITVDDGSRRVPIQNTRGEEIGAFTLRPTDMGIVQRYNDMVAQFDAVIEPLQALGEEEGEIDLSDPRYVAAIGEATRRVHDAVNTLFDSDDAAAAFFGRMNPFSPVDGEFYCAKVLNAVGEYIGQAFETETAKFSEKAKGYANRATRRSKK